MKYLRRIYLWLTYILRGHIVLSKEETEISKTITKIKPMYRILKNNSGKLIGVHINPGMPRCLRDRSRFSRDFRVNNPIYRTFDTIAKTLTAANKADGLPQTKVRSWAWLFEQYCRQAN